MTYKNYIVKLIKKLLTSINFYNNIKISESLYLIEGKEENFNKKELSRIFAHNFQPQPKRKENNLTNKFIYCHGR